MYHLSTILEDPLTGGRFVDQDAFACAFSFPDDTNKPSLAPQVFELVDCLPCARDICLLGTHFYPIGDQSSFIGLADLGCGPASTLIPLVQHYGDRLRHAYGVDISAAMCNRATMRIKDKALNDRIDIIRGDSRCIDQLLGAGALARVNVIYLGSMMNELFGAESGNEVSFR